MRRIVGQGSSFLVFALCFSLAAPAPLFFNPAISHGAELPAQATQDQKKIEQIRESYSTLKDTLMLALGGWVKCHPLDMFCTLNQGVDPRAKTVSIDPAKIHLRFFGIHDGRATRVIARQDRARFIDADQPGFARRDLPRFPQAAKMELWFQDHPLHEFSLKIKNATFWGKYLVFTEEDGYLPQSGIQNLRFIDLETFESALAHEEIPIYRVPIKTDQETQSLTIQNGKLVLRGFEPEQRQDQGSEGGRELSREELDFFNDINEAAFNSVANLLDPMYYARSRSDISQLISTFFEAAKRSDQAIQAKAASLMGGPKALEAFLNEWVRKFETVKGHEQASRPAVDKARKIVQETKRAKHQNLEAQALPEIEGFLEAFSRVHEPLQDVDDARKLLKSQRKLLTRARNLVNRISLPRPSGAPKIREALAFVAAGIRGSSGDRVQDLKEAGLQLLHHPATQTAGVISALALGAHYPEICTQFMLKSLEVSQTLVEGTLGMAYNWTVGNLKILGFSVWEMMKSPMGVWQTYFANGNWDRTKHAMKSVFFWLYGRVVIPHIAVNCLALAWDLRKIEFERYVKDWDQKPALIKLVRGPLALFPWFIDRQEKAAEEYLADLAASRDKRTKKQKEEEAKFTPEQERMVHSAFERIEEEKEGKSGFLGFFKRFKDSRLVEWFGRTFEKDHGTRVSTATERLATTAHAIRHSSVVRFGNALGSLFVSFPAFTNTFVATIQAWNYAVYPIRTFLFNPFTLLPAYAFYPEFFVKSVSEYGRPERPGDSEQKKARKDHLTIPTARNGGNRNLFQSLYRIYFQDEELRAKMDAWEERVVDVEFEIQRVAMDRAYLALLDYLQTHGGIRELVKAGGIYSISDPALRDIGRKARVFHRHYFNELFERGMKAYLLRLGAECAIEIPENASPAELKRLLLEQTDRMTASHQDAVSIIDQVLKEDDGEGKTILKQATEAAAGTLTLKSVIQGNQTVGDLLRGAANMKGLQVDTKYNLLLKANPEHDRTAQRIAITHNALQDADLIQRVVLKQISKYLIDIPQEFAIMMLFYAGATSAELIPIQEEEFSDTSWNHASKVVVKSWMIGTFTTFLANAWVDLQQLARQHQEFGRVPTDPNVTLTQWFLHEGWNAPSNSLILNWKDHNNVMIANIKAGLSLAIATSIATYGRWDIDLWILGIALGLGTPYGALGYKIENAFERFSDIVYARFPEEIRLHPRVLEWGSREKQMLRLKFNFWYRLLYDNPVGYALAFAELTAVPGMGTRSFLRNNMGNTPTNYFLYMSQYLQEKMGVQPGSQWLIEGCESFLANEYPALDPELAELRKLAEEMKAAHSLKSP